MFTYPYPRPSVTVDSIIIKNNEQGKYILLIQRKHEPCAGLWAIPGGFVDMDELLETAAIRELKEETSVEIDSLTQFYTFDALDRDPRGRTLSVVFYGIIGHNPTIKAQDDAQNVAWFPINNLPDLAFDHANVLKQFFDKIKL